MRDFDQRLHFTMMMMMTMTLLDCNVMNGDGWS